MVNVNGIEYKYDYQKPRMSISDKGYLCSTDYLGGKDNLDHGYCEEVDIINRIIDNEEGYFDFSKNLIDIGSYIGTYSFILPFNYAYMFEGNKDKCIIAQMNMLLHHKQHNFECHNVLLSDKVEYIAYDGFNTNYDNINEHFNDFGNDVKDDNILNVQTKLLDNFNCNNVGLIKVDVESMEYYVLRGGLGTIIRNNYPPILFELWPVNFYGMTQEKHDRLQNFLEDLGYEILWKWGDFETHLAIHK